MNVDREAARLEEMTVGQLRKRYEELFGENSRTGNKAWLLKRILWRVQSSVEGGLSERARQRAAELANDADLRLTPPRLPTAAPDGQGRTVTTPVRFGSGRRLPPAGTVLTRDYKGRTLQVRVLEAGFEYEGETYRTLSALANHITGSHVNGFQFFRMNKEGK